jgi:Flp pilus assembly protein protease CpaA
VAKAGTAVGAIEDYFQRVLRVLTLLVDMHMDIAIQEANYERRRLIGGFILLGIGIGLFAMGMTLLQVLGVLAAHRLGLNWMLSTTLVAGVDFIVGGVFAAAARLRLQGPLMVQTQQRLVRSASMLRRGSTSD